MMNSKCSWIFSIALSLLLCMNVSASDRSTQRSELPITHLPANEMLTQFTDMDSSALASYIVDYMEDHHIPGLSCAVVKDGEVIWNGAYGNAYFNPWIPTADSTLFMLASISKTITGTALMQLWEGGAFQLDDPVNDYLPFAVIHPRYPDTDITFKMLLTHTSGIEDNWDYMPYYPGDSPIPLGEYLENYLVEGGAYYNQWWNYSFWRPGTAYSYSNVAVALVGYLVEVISGTAFDQYCEGNIFPQLEMDETAWFLADLDTMQVAQPNYWNGNSYIPYVHFGYSDYPSGQLRTSALELLNFLTSYLQMGQWGGYTILDSATVAQMLSPQIPQIDPSQGLIWYKSYVGGRELWGHGGGDVGVTTEMYHCPDQNSGVVILTNGESYFFEILDALFDYAELYDAGLLVDMIPDNPPIIIPSGGGDFTYDITITNSDINSITFDLWIDALLPNGNVFGPIILRNGITLSSGSYINRNNIMQTVPASAPAGEYSYRAHVGEYPGVVITSDSFTFTKLSDGDGAIAESKWQLSGWDEGEIANFSAVDDWVLVSAYPNPFNPRAVISFSLPVSSMVKFDVFDISGSRVGVACPFGDLASTRQYPPGTHQITFDGSGLPSGIYIYQLTTGESTTVGKMVLMK
ncbi:hypothetical protein CEE37_15015 [candidate division LCP-89 bacterium B3_LCP]|uniref:Beta-lactamase-related domain-containing protein n=1 Tax=candidate division LCP-89 bacterium B3_LCP TaxID=2012998 RepID=A0A532UNT0_UNCL8|nr:MAG: hypothetical protein CEE37_15015 [candidate division LCP-89 bacterium B3_LCP]